MCMKVLGSNPPPRFTYAYGKGKCRHLKVIVVVFGINPVSSEFEFVIQW